MGATSAEQALVDVQAHYAARINAAVAAGRMELVRDLTQDYLDEALELVLASGDSAPRHSAEILEFGPAWPRGTGRGARRLRLRPHRQA